MVVTFNAPVANRRAAERAIDVKSAPAMTGKFEWLDNDVVQWVPDRFWPAHSTVALSVGGLSTDFQPALPSSVWPTFRITRSP